MFTQILSLLIYLVLIGIVFYLIVWVLQSLGIPVPPKVLQLLGVLVLLLVILWFVSGNVPVLPFLARPL